MKFLLLCLALLLPLKGGEHDRLLELAEKWEVPQPKPGSKLIKIRAYCNSTGEFYNLGFVEPNDPKRALVGLEKIRIDQKTSTPPLPVPNIEKLSLKNVVASGIFGNSNSGLVTAIQLMRMGHQKIGRELLTQSLKSDTGHHRSPPVYQRRTTSRANPRLFLPRCCHRFHHHSQAGFLANQTTHQSRSQRLPKAQEPRNRAHLEGSRRSP